MNAGWVIFAALMFLSFWPHPYFEKNPNVREAARFGLFLFFANFTILGMFPLTKMKAIA